MELVVLETTTKLCHHLHLVNPLRESIQDMPMQAVVKKNVYLGLLLKLNLDNVDYLSTNDIIPWSCHIIMISWLGLIPQSEKLL